MTYLMSYVTFLSNTWWFYELSNNELEKIRPNQYKKSLCLGGYGFNLDKGLVIVVGEDIGDGNQGE